MHADHAGGELVTATEAAAAHHGDGHGGVDLVGEGLELHVGAAAHHAAAADQQRLPGAVDHLHQLVDVIVIRLRSLEVQRGALHQHSQTAAHAVIPAAQGQVIAHSGGDVLGNVDQHRAGPAAAGDGEGLAHRVGQILHPANQVIALGDGHGHAGDVHLLEGVLADEVGGHVAGDAHDGRGIHVGGGDAGDQIGAAGAGGGEAHAHLAGGTGVAVRGVARALLVGGQDVPDLFPVAVQLVVNVQDGAARVAENCIDTLFEQAFHQNFCAGHLHDLSLLVQLQRYAVKNACRLKVRPQALRTSHFRTSGFRPKNFRSPAQNAWHCRA